MLRENPDKYKNSSVEADVDCVLENYISPDVTNCQLCHPENIFFRVSFGFNEVYPIWDVSVTYSVYSGSLEKVIVSFWKTSFVKKCLDEEPSGNEGAVQPDGVEPEDGQH